MAFAFAAAAATCRLGVTGGSTTSGDAVCPVGVVMPARSSSMSMGSAGGVAGATTAAAAAFANAVCFFISSTAAHFDHSNCLRYMYCCCGPTTLPGRTMRMKAIASFAVKPYFQIMYAPMSVPVRPKPALHCNHAS